MDIRDVYRYEINKFISQKDKDTLADVVSVKELELAFSEREKKVGTVPNTTNRNSDDATFLKLRELFCFTAHGALTLPGILGAISCIKATEYFVRITLLEDQLDNDTFCRRYRGLIGHDDAILGYLNTRWENSKYLRQALDMYSDFLPSEYDDHEINDFTCRQTEFEFMAAKCEEHVSYMHGRDTKHLDIALPRYLVNRDS